MMNLCWYFTLVVQEAGLWSDILCDFAYIGHFENFKAFPGNCGMMPSCMRQYSLLINNDPF